MEEQYEHITKEEGFKRVKEIIPVISDSYISHCENQIPWLHDKEKLSMWIIGLTVAIEFFLLSKLDKQDFSTWTVVVLFSIISFLTAISAFNGLLMKLKKSRLLNYYIDMIILLQYQKSDILMRIDSDLKLKDELLDDYANAKLHDSILALKYGTPPKTEKHVIADADNFVNKSDNLTSGILVIQVILTTILYIYLTYQ